MKSVIITLFFFILFLPWSSAVLTDDLIAHYNMSSNGADELGVNNMSVVGSPTHGSGGVIGDKVFFDGVDDGYKNTTFVGVRGATGLTVSYWHNYSACSNDIPFSLRNTSNGHYFLVELMRDISGDGSSDGCDGRMEYTDSSGTNRASPWIDGFLANSQWQMITIILSSNGLLMYNNVTAVVNVSAFAPSKTFTKVEVGQFAEGTFFYALDMDEIKVWNRTLSHSEVVSLYTSESSGVGRPWVESSCTYAGSGAHTYQGSDNCVIASTVDFMGSAVLCNGSGSLTVGSGGSLVNFSSVSSVGGCVTAAQNGGLIV